MKNENLNTIEALELFLQGTQPVPFSVLGSKVEHYDFIRKTLVKFHFVTLPYRTKVQSFGKPGYIRIDTVHQGDRDKVKGVYPYKSMMTPCEKLKSLPDAEQYLKPEISLEELDEYAQQVNDIQSAKAMQEARKQLLALIFRPDKTG